MPATTVFSLNHYAIIEPFKWCFYNRIDLTCDYKYLCASCFEQYADLDNGKSLPLFVNRTVHIRFFFCYGLYYWHKVKHIYLDIFPTLQFLILNIVAVSSVIKRMFAYECLRLWSKLSLEKTFWIRVT